MKFAAAMSVVAAWFFATGVVDYYKYENGDYPPFIGFVLSTIFAVVAAWMWGL